MQWHDWFSSDDEGVSVTRSLSVKTLLVQSQVALVTRFRLLPGYCFRKRYALDLWVRVWSVHLPVRRPIYFRNRPKKVPVWLSGNALVSINVVTLRRARLVPGWVTVFGG